MKESVLMRDFGLYVIEEVDSPLNNGVIRLINGTHIGKGFGVRLPSGMIHWYDTAEEATSGAYWPIDGAKFYPCIHCNTDTRYRSRYSGEPTCGSCLV